MRQPQKYPWHKNGQRFDLVLIGEPDAFAYIIRYWSEKWKSSVWCWRLTMPRGGRETARGFGSNPHEAKRQVEAKIRELSQ